MQESIDQLQEIISHQELEIGRLSDELYTQQQEIAVLRQQMAQLHKLWQQLHESPDQQGHSGYEPPPPHY